MTGDPKRLEDATALASLDPGGMLGLVAALGSQLRNGFELGRSVEEPPSGEGVRSIAVCGMGGSGIAGDILRSLFSARLPFPIVVTKGYELPEFCGRDTVVIASSYSGDTEETLSAFDEGVGRGCRVVSVSAGGELGSRSVRQAVPHVAVPRDIPVPRAALGYLAAAPIGLLDIMGLIPPAAYDVARAAESLDSLARSLSADVPVDRNVAKALAVWLLGRTPLIWGSEGLAEAPALRWKTQMNENAKVPAFHAVLPELDHNDVEGWSPSTGTPYGVVVLRHAAEHPRIAARVDATFDVIAEAGLEGREVSAPGPDPMDILFSLIMLGDFTSTYLGLARGIDPTPVPVLMGLKERLRR
ncbi:bifunctional phosphoglucose/phosphomannose isomerase [soil metagenome]